MTVLGEDDVFSGYSLIRKVKAGIAAIRPDL